MIKTVFHLLSSKIFFFLVTTLIILSLNLTPLILQTIHAPPGRTFVLIHNNAQDFFFYQSLMNEGANGQWLTTDPYTTEPHESSIIFSYFLWLGKLAKLLHLPYAIMYHLIRIILSILFLLTTYYLLLSTRIPYPRLTYFFFLFATPFMHWTEEFGYKVYAPFMNWWTGMDPLRRIAYLPHHMLGALGIVLIILSLYRYHKSKNPKLIIFISLLSSVLAFVHPPSLLVILMAIPPTFITYSILNKKIDTKSLPGLIIFFIIVLVSIFIMYYETQKGFPWKQAHINWESRLQFPLDKEIIGAFGFLVPFSMLGIFESFRSKKFIYLLVTFWLTTPLALIPFASSLGISNIRLIQGVPYLPLSILATIGIQSLISFIISRFVNKKVSIVTLLHCSIVTLFLFSSYPTLSWSLSSQVKEFWPIFGNIYIDNRLNKAFQYINQKFPPKTIILATFYSGNFLPAYTHTVSFIGHSGYTYEIDQKQEKVIRFFENKMDQTEAKEFITANKITLIYQGPEEKPIYNGLLYPEVLKPIYDKEEATLYILK